MAGALDQRAVVPLDHRHRLCRGRLEAASARTRTAAQTSAIASAAMGVIGELV